MSIFDLAGGAGHTDGPADVRCSRKGCRSGAQWQILWNNPRIHTPERRKIWLACGDHRGWLEDYLQQRGMFKETLALTQDPQQAGADPAGSFTAGQES